MTLYRNADSQTRIWPGLQRPDNRTLELEAGEEAELDLPAGFKDPWLVPVAVPASAKKADLSAAKAELAKAEADVAAAEAPDPAPEAAAPAAAPKE